MKHNQKTKIGSMGRLADTHVGYGKMLKQKGDRVKAKTQYQNALKYYMKLGNKVRVKDIRDALAILEKKV